MPLYTQEQFDLTRHKLNELKDYWQRIMGLGNWEITIFHEYDPKDTSRDCAADCNAQWDYMQATLTFYHVSLCSYEDSELEYLVVHELSHCLVSELSTLAYTGDEFQRTCATRHEERTVTQLAKAYIWAHKAGGENLFNGAPETIHPWRCPYENEKEVE